ncbi:MAG: RES family NAD+ phosphorylase [Candidatus Eisenbacteria bacterium]|nr:RES family NAD+ phosphorylase [Candidatus Eisenbacteria bacterium]
MILRPHPLPLRTTRALRRLAKSAQPWAGTVFRTGTGPMDPPRLLSGEGALASGGRWNAPGAFRVVYVSLTAETALSEALARFRSAGVPDSAAMPLLVVAVQVRLKLVLDLSDDASIRAAGLARRSLLGEDWRRSNQEGKEALAQAVGRTVQVLELEGLLVPSAAAPGQTNLVVFPDRVRPGGGLRIRRPGRH